MGGFISCSLEERNIANFIGNAVIKITVKKKNLGGFFDNGFACLEKIARYAEKEVLFNALNLFRIFRVQKRDWEVKVDFADDPFHWTQEVWVIEL